MEDKPFDYDAFLARLRPSVEPVPVELAGQKFCVRPLRDAGEVVKIEREAFSLANLLKDENSALPPAWQQFRDAEPEIIEAVTWCREVVVSPKLNDLQWFGLASASPLFYDFARQAKAVALQPAAARFVDKVEAEGEG